MWLLHLQFHPPCTITSIRKQKILSFKKKRKNRRREDERKGIVREEGEREEGVKERGVESRGGKKGGLVFLAQFLLNAVL